MTHAPLPLWDAAQPAEKARRGDPETSVRAAARSHAASWRAVLAVYELMCDWQPRSDEEIWAELRRRGTVLSDGTIRHGRLVLSKRGVLQEQPQRGTTRLGSPTRLWRLAQRAAELDAALLDAKGESSR